MRTVHSTQRSCALFWSFQVMVETILPETPVGNLEMDLSEWCPVARGQGSGQQPPAWSTQRSSLVAGKGMPFREIL